MVADINLIYKTNLADVGFANSPRTMIWCPLFDFGFKNIERFRGLYILRGHIPQSRFIMNSVPKKTVREFLLVRWTPLLSS